MATRVGREVVSRFVDFRIFNLTRLSRAKRANSYLLVEQNTYLGTTVWDDYQWAGATRRSEGQGLGGGSRRAGVKFLAAFNLSPCGLYAFKRIAVAANNALETHMADNNAAFGWSRTGSRPLRIILLDGPNMPNLGNRNKRVYGPIASIEALQTYLKEVGAKLGVTIEALASNHEGCILDEIHRTAAQCDAYILNPAGLTKTGEPTRHALWRRF